VEEGRVEEDETARWKRGDEGVREERRAEGADAGGAAGYLP